MPIEWNFGASASARRFVVAAAAVLAAGCGDDGFPARYPVTGRVTYQGQPLRMGTITFAPVDAAHGRAASGFIDQGAYALTTVEDQDGAIPGQYQVSIVSQDVDLSKAEAASKKDGGAFREDLVAKAKIKPN